MIEQTDAAKAVVDVAIGDLMMAANEVIVTVKTQLLAMKGLNIQTQVESKKYLDKCGL